MITLQEADKRVEKAVKRVNFKIVLFSLFIGFALGGVSTLTFLNKMDTDNLEKIEQLKYKIKKLKRTHA